MVVLMRGHTETHSLGFHQWNSWLRSGEEKGTSSK